ncbi:unnamed protein product [Eruca vesicaria subsp. sativa]|uniref:Peroxisomal membrane protein PEX16 n=1 Tax=Eruca vesicaria subsp. sativa TaxID=29727 RepID=A0ABC8LJT7_ERUVS|nr:unnamed protein product [Eruca vesicaria subsp. sativa]
MEAYKQWVRRNREYVHSLGSLANGLTWLLPEKFSASEIGPEAVTAFLGIFTTINEHIIESVPTTRAHVGPSGTDDDSSLSYPLLISILKDLETVVEVAAEHFYGDRKWNFIIATEALKALIRLALFRNTGYKMLLHGGETPNDDKDPNQSQPQNRAGTLDRNRLGNQNHYNPWNLEGRAMSALSSFGQNARTTPTSPPSAWSRRIQHQQAVIEPAMIKEKRRTLSELLSEKGVKGALFVIGEVLCITRPLIYVIFIRRYGIRSWIPWAISLSVDALGMGILSNLKLWGEKSKQIHFSQLERDEEKKADVGVVPHERSILHQVHKAEAGKLSEEGGTSSFDRLLHRENCGAFGGSSVTVHLHIGILSFITLQQNIIATVERFVGNVTGFVRSCVYCS